MKKTKILTIVLCLMLVLSSIGFVACGGNDSEESEHTYETAWTYDATDHWHKCTQEGCTSVSGKASHNFVNGVCECGAKKNVEVTTEMLTAFTKSTAEIKNSQGYNVIAKDIKVSVDDAPYSAKKSEEEGRVEIPARGDLTADVEIFVGKDAEGNFDAKGNVSIIATVYKDTTAKEFKEVSDTISVMTVKAAFAVKGDYVYLHYEITDSAEGIPAGWSTYIEKESQDIKMTIEELLDLIFDSNDSEDESTEQTVIYQSLPEIAEKVANYIQPILDNVYTVSMGFGGEYLTNIIENTTGITEAEDGYIFAEDLEKTKTMINDLIDLKMGEFINKYVGENSFETLALFVKNVANMKIKDVVTFAETKLGFDFGEAEKFVNEIFEIVYSQEDGEPAPTLAELLEYVDKTKEDGTPYTLKDFVLETVQDATVAEMIEQIAGIEEGKVNEYINKAVIFIRNNTCLDALSLIGETDFTAEKEQIRETAMGVVTVIDKVIKCELKTAKDGTFKAISVNVAIDDESMSAIIGILQALDEDIDTENLEGVNVDAKISVSIGEFANALKFDYNKFISDIDAEFPTDVNTDAVAA